MKIMQFCIKINLTWNAKTAITFAFRMYLLRELSLYPLLLSSVFVPTSVLIHVSVPDNKGVPRAPISQGITLLDNSPEFPPKLDQTQLIPASPISFCHWTQENFPRYSWSAFWAPKRWTDDNSDIEFSYSNGISLSMEN